WLGIAWSFQSLGAIQTVSRPGPSLRKKRSLNQALSRRKSPRRLLPVGWEESGSVRRFLLEPSGGHDFADFFFVGVCGDGGPEALIADFAKHLVRQAALEG